jgi:hypothetical protein
MSCELTEKISLLIDGELSASEARTVERHLHDCLECQDARADFLNLRSQLGAYPAAGPRAAPRHELANLLVKSPGAARIKWGLPLRPALATVALVLLVAMAVVVGLRLKRSAGHDFPVVHNNEPERVKQDKDQVVKQDPSKQNPPEGQKKVDPLSAVQQNNLVVSRGGKSGSQKSSRPRSETSSAAANVTESDATALNPNRIAASRPTAADTETLTSHHVEQSELLLRSFRNLRQRQRSDDAELDHERRRAQQLFYQNVLLRREADSAGDVQFASLLESLEPILLDIANLPQRARREEVSVIKERIGRQNLVALLQINSTALARANE